MMNYQNYDNKAKLIGKLEAPFKYGYEIDGKVFYLSTLLVRRVSGTYDRIPLCISENKLKQFSSDIYEEKVLIEGFIISYRNVNNNLKVKVRINNMLTMPEHTEDVNLIKLTAELTNNPTVRQTPFGRQIADMGLLIKAGGWMKFFVPAICWGWIADMAKEFTKGIKLSVRARFQSREYEKLDEDGNVKKHETFELSIYRCYKL